MKLSPGITAFNSGELSRALEGRSDIKQYATGCYALENFTVMVQGPARRRPGTRFVREVKNSANKTAITEFVFNTATSFILEWGSNYLRFYQNHAVVGAPYEIATPYSAVDLFDADGFFQLVFVQSADVVYIVHRSKTFPVYKLSHFAATTWTLAALVPIGGPFADANPGTNPIVYASAETGTGITLTASADIFDADLVGAYFQLTEQNIRDIRPWESGKKVTKGDRRRYNGVSYEAMNGTVPGPGTPVTGTVPPTHISGQAHDGGGGGGILWEYRDPGYGFVKITARGAAPSGGTVAITGITANKPPVVTTGSVTGAANGDVIFITGVVGMTEVNDKFFVVNNKAGSTIELQQVPDGGGPADDVDGSNWSSYTSGGTVSNRLWTATADVLEQATAGVVNRLPQTVVGYWNATSIWAVGDWNNRDGYPNGVCFSRGRLIFGRDGVINGSVSQDFENFSALTPNALVTKDMAFRHTLPTQDPLMWLADGRVLLAGMQNAEHAIQEINPGEAFGPGNIRSSVQLRHGSRPVRPVGVGKSILWAQTSGIKVRAMKYAFAEDNYDSADLNALHDTITQSGIVGMCYQQEPDSVVWVWLRDGRLIGLTFNEEQNVIAWHRHPMVVDALVESAANIPAPDGSREDPWMIVSRIINGQVRRYIEYIPKDFATGDNIVTDAFYADSGITYNGAPTLSVSVPHLEGRTVKVLADGMRHPDCIVTGGTITLEFAASVVQVGLPQVAKLTTMPLGDQTQQGHVKRITSVVFRFLNTLYGEAGRDDPTNPSFDNVEMRNPIDPMNAQVPVFSGLWPTETEVFPWPAGYEAEGRVTYKNEDPFPVTVVSIYPDFDVT